MASKFLLIKDGTYHESVIDRYHMQEVFNVGFYTMKGNSILFYPYDYRQKIDSSRVFQGDMRGRKLTLKYQNANEEVLKECWCKHYDKLSSLSTQLNSPTKIE